MLVPIEWLKDYIDINIDINDFCERMIMSGSNIEGVESFGENIENVVVGKVIEKKKHPDADKLSVCTIDIGVEEKLQIVCGAPNVKEGIKVPVALHNSIIPGKVSEKSQNPKGIKITKGKLRGVESNGMICSAGELGFDDKVVPIVHREGIWILPEDVEIGSDFSSAMVLKNSVVEFEITPNRADCLSILGMTREVGATFGGNKTYPNLKVLEEGEKESKEFISVKINNPENCKRYVARVVTDVKIEQSPWWMQKRLMYAGMRPINNIVDITNFVMLEYGHPIHAFDIRQIEDKEIIVENAKDGEVLTTLDEKERKLTKEMLLIKDGKKGIAIAGVMGGLNSDIEEDTTTILIEAANFNQDNIRLTSKKLGLRTEASSRYEKGIDPNICREAADRVCQLIEILGAGKVQKGAVDVYPEPKESWTVDVRLKRVNDILGINLQEKDIKDIFESLEIKVECEAGVLKATPPTIRLDLLREIDFIEEIARIYGYDKLPNTLPKGNSEANLGQKETMRKLARETMCAMGANEIQTYSFVSPKDMDKVGMDEDSWERNFVEIKNPLGEENSVMRTILTPAMLETLGRNFSRKVEKVTAFEIGNTFSKNILEPDHLPDEQDAMSIGMYGKKVDFFTLKGMIVKLLANFGITDVTFEAESEYKLYHPGRCARIIATGTPPKTLSEDVLSKANEKIEGTEEELELMKEMVAMMVENMEGAPVELGIMGEIHPDVADEYGIDTRCYCCEIMFNTLCDFADTKTMYKPLPKYPSTSRDIALSIDEDLAVGKIEEKIKQKGGDILESVRLFDIYRGQQVGEHKKSVAFTLTYRDKNKTLTDDDVKVVHDIVLKSLEEDFNAVLREL